MDRKGLTRMKGFGWWNCREGRGSRLLQTGGRAGLKTDSSGPCSTWHAPLAPNVVPVFNKHVLNRLHSPLKTRLVPTSEETPAWGHV